MATLSKLFRGLRQEGKIHREEHSSDESEINIPSVSMPSSKLKENFFRRILIQVLLLGVVIVSAYQYSQGTFETLSRARMMIRGLEEKPYVYRALIPWLGRFLSTFGLRADVALTAIIILSAIGLLYAIQYLLCLNHPENCGLREFLEAVVAVEIFMSVFFLESKIYDLSTAMFFAFSLGLLAREKFREFYLLYPLACLNRETTILLSVFFAIYFFKKLKPTSYWLGLAYQVSVFLTTRWMLMKVFERNPGQLFYFSFTRVLGDYWSHPAFTLALLALLAPAVYFVASHWKAKPLFLRSALLLFLPVLVFAHLFSGMAFEIRVFAEVFPIMWVLGLWKKL